MNIKTYLYTERQLLARFMIICLIQMFSYNLIIGQDDSLIHLTPTENSYPFWSPDGNNIVFHSNRAGNDFEIYKMRSDGTELLRLTFSCANDLTPVWSPDGTRIAFQSLRDGNEELYVMNADGSCQRNLTYSQESEMHPKWHPKEDKLIFSVPRGYWKVVDHWKINTDGTELDRITKSVTIDTYAEWSPDGNKIVGRRIIGAGDSEIFLFNSDGSNAVNLTNSETFDGWPSWHPLGQKIIYASENEEGIAKLHEVNINSHVKRMIFDRPGYWSKPIWNKNGDKILCTRTLNGNVDIFIVEINEDGNIEKLTNVYPIKDKYPVISPDGTKIAFQSNRFGKWQIFVMNIDGSNITRLTENDANDVHPSWSKCGRNIAFVSDRDGNREIYVMNNDGTNQMNISQNPSEDSHPNWSNDSKRIIFNSYRNNPEYLRIFSMNIDGSNIQLLSNPKINYSESYASYSPDDSKIVFVRWLEDRNGEIFVMNSDGTNPKNLTIHDGFDGYPCWSGNGDKILFSSNRSGSFKLYSIDISGNNLSKLISDTTDYAEVRANCAKDDSQITFNMQDREGNIRIHLMKKVNE